MPTKMTTTTPPETLEQRAERAAAELAKVEAERLAIAQADAERQRAHEARFDAELIASYLDRKARLEADVTDARRVLDEAIAESPLTRALAGYYAATAVRHQAFSDYLAAEGRRGRDVGSVQHPEQPRVYLAEAIETSAQRAAVEARAHAAAATDRARHSREEAK